MIDFNYLGSTVQEDGNDRNTEKRFQGSWNNWRKITGVIFDKKVPENVKGKMYKTIVRPAMLYGMGAVAMTKRQERKMEVTETKMLGFLIGSDKVGQVLGMKK